MLKIHQPPRIKLNGKWMGNTQHKKCGKIKYAEPLILLFFLAVVFIAIIGLLAMYFAGIFI